jgi:hypothetical protein
MKSCKNVNFAKQHTTTRFVVKRYLIHLPLSHQIRYNDHASHQLRDFKVPEVAVNVKPANLREFNYTQF